MKKLFGFLTLAIVVGGGVVLMRQRAEAMPPPPAVRIICDGNNLCCYGTGGTSQGLRQFVYNVRVPGGGAVSVTSVDVGTHLDNTLSDYVHLVMPAGWTLTIPPTAPPDSSVCTQHGNVSAISGTCQYILHFSGPAQTGAFTLAYDFVPNFDIHDATWVTSNGSRANWSAPVGAGEGPVHSPMVP